MDRLFDSMDIDQSGNVEFTEFIAAMLDHRKYDSDEEKIRMAFDSLDADKSGFIERNELANVLGSHNLELVDYIIGLVDINKDGKISFEEFKDLMTSESFATDYETELED